MKPVANQQPTAPAPQQSPEVKELLAQLHDIHEPAPVGWWPPAPGWWALAALLLGIIFAGVLWIRRRQRRRAQNRYRVEAVRLLQLIDTEHAGAPQEINEILKRVAVITFGRTECGNLTGRRWLEFLNASAPIECPPEVERALLESLYRADRSDTPGNIALRDFAMHWVESHGRAPATAKPAIAEASGV
ncbi:DUF4381 domain-containing protein [Microbulbifer hainanensis]|uniref:DUF4381 domain-containing protein n=1 Tax=Microbulbifer hainanensis TaxID=2735675 RepID=UPI001868A4F3|nr:DUF4381 domain-containing protein [Microbulbifer hainanensis]